MNQAASGNELRQPAHTLAFGPLTIDPNGRQLWKNGIPVPLADKPFEALLFLVQHRDRVVTKDELKAGVWHCHISGNSVDQAISRIRAALGDARQELVQTVHGQGYRFTGVVQESESQLLTSPAGASRLISPARPVGRRAWPLVAICCLLLAVVAIGILWRAQRQFPPNLRVVASSARPKLSPVLHSNGRLYFTETQDGDYHVGRVSNHGGAVEYLNTGVRAPYACAVSPDGNRLLIRSVTSDFNQDGPMWIVDLRGGKPRDLNFSGFDGAWSQDGSRLLLTASTELFSLDLRTGERIRLLSAPGHVWWPRWSPDRRRIRFTVTDTQSMSHAIWEARADGTQALRWTRGTGESQCCGSWTDKGDQFVFQAHAGGGPAVWLAEERRWPWITRAPGRVTPALMPFRGPTYANGVLFARVHVPAGEALKYNEASDTYESILPGISIKMLEFSPGGQSVAWTLAEDGSLWYGNPDGSRPRRLVESKVQTGVFRWSRDGQRLAMMVRELGRKWRIATASLDGETEYFDVFPGNAVGPDWSPDNTELVFGTVPVFEDPARVSLYTLNLSTRRVARLPNSGRLFNPRWSPGGRLIAALEVGANRLAVYDRQSGQTRIITQHPALRPSWTVDGRYIRYARPDLGIPELYRVEVATGHQVPLLKARPSRSPSLFRGEWLGWHPDGSPLIVRDASRHDIVAIEP
jgi:Tol biopolymer transport system component/DNA-binding winged helix-turn-helix (wHTH) protein